MSDDELRQNILQILNMTDASKEIQDEALYRVESIANKRLARAIPDMLSEEQLKHVESMYDSGKNDDDIVDWVHGQLPEFDEMLNAVILDVADEAASI
jgi:hypothetical protein